MNSDDSDPAEGESAETSRSEPGAVGGGGQPRDPETGQFLPKDRRSGADDDNGVESNASRPESGSDGAASSRVDARARPSAPDRRPRPGLRFVRVRAGVAGGDSARSTFPRRRPEHAVSVSSPAFLPPSLHLVPMQVQRTGEVVTVDAAPDGHERRSVRFDV